ncbi:MAG: hypothetical protein RL071_91 [Pseudomonadota bacterium]
MQLLATRPAPQGLHRDGGPPAPRSRAPSGSAAPAASAGNGAPQASPVVRAMALVADELAAAEQVLVDELRGGEAAVAAIGGYLAEAGGKRLRPLLTALGARAVGFTGPLPRLMCVGEVLHLGSLLHDDVVDEADDRRGRPAAHRVFGNAGVILTGDVCLARAVLLAAEAGGLRPVTELGRVVVEMSEGEVLQLRHRGDLSLPLPAYWDIIERKSAALIAWCAAAGAWASDQGAAADALVAYGRGVGVAFQVTDDVLDYIGDPAVTGKARGRDLCERKLTLPLLLAIERDPELRGLLGHLPAPQALRPAELEALVERVIATGGPAEALAVARAQVEGAVGALHERLPPSPFREGLVALGHHLVERVR